MILCGTTRMKASLILILHLERDLDVWHFGRRSVGSAYLEFVFFGVGKVVVCVIKEMRVNDVSYYKYIRMFCRM